MFTKPQVEIAPGTKLPGVFILKGKLLEGKLFKHHGSWKGIDTSLLSALLGDFYNLAGAAIGGFRYSYRPHPLTPSP
jgi:hypothetical protein